MAKIEITFRSPGAGGKRVRTGGTLLEEVEGVGAGGGSWGGGGGGAGVSCLLFLTVLYSPRQKMAFPKFN